MPWGCFSGHGRPLPRPPAVACASWSIRRRSRASPAAGQSPPSPPTAVSALPPPPGPVPGTSPAAAEQRRFVVRLSGGGLRPEPPPEKELCRGSVHRSVWPKGRPPQSSRPAVEGPGPSRPFSEGGSGQPRNVWPGGPKGVGGPQKAELRARGGVWGVLDVVFGGDNRMARGMASPADEGWGGGASGGAALCGPLRRGRRCSLGDLEGAR